VLEVLEQQQPQVQLAILYLVLLHQLLVEVVVMTTPIMLQLVALVVEVVREL
jgi:hypothetical protein